MISAKAKGRYDGLLGGKAFLMLFAILYMISPADFVPEMFLPFVGLLDDAFVAAWLAGAILDETDAYLHWEKTTPGSVNPPLSGDIVEESPRDNAPPR